MKKIYVTKPYLPSIWTSFFYYSRLWKSRILTNNGFYSQKFVQKLASFLKNNSVTLFTNGHLVLEYILDSIQIKGEIITTPFTFISTTQSIIRTGNIPVFCDVKDDFTIDESKIESLITNKTIAILAVHVYGNICAVDKLADIGRKHNILIIYDAAHAFNVIHKNKNISNFGDFVMYSFQATKVFHTVEGGALITNNLAFPKKLFEVKRNFGQESQESITELGGNAKIDEFRSIIGILNLKKFPREVMRRNRIYNRYFKHLSKVDGIKLNPIQENVKTNHSYFPVIFDGYKLNRNQVFNLLQKYNIFARKYFYPLTSKAKAFVALFPIQDTPKALEYSEKVLTLPFYGELSLSDVDRICKIILRGY